MSVDACLSTVVTDRDRVSMHGVRRSLLERQVEALGVRLDVVELPPEASNDVYRSRMREQLDDYADAGIEAVAFGDLALEDVRAYREELFEASPIDGRWPVWGRDTAGFAEEFIDDGYEAIVVCVDGDQMGQRAVGRTYDSEFLADLPDGVDPCGENGEFHTFVCDGPIFDVPVPVERGDCVTRTLEGGTFHYQDLVPAG